MKLRQFAAAVLLTLLGSSLTQALPLWEVDNAKGRMFILGSVHFLRAEDHPLPEPMQAAYRGADVIVMELDLDDLNPIQAQAALTRMAIDPDGRNLAELMGRKDFETARRDAAAIQIDLSTMQTFEPWYAALQVTQLRLAQLGLDPGYGVESRLVIAAKRDGKEIRGLETFEEQLGALDALPLPAQNIFLLQTLEEAADIQDSMDSILRDWRRGDVDALERELLAGLSDQPELYERILVERNRRWTEVLAKLAGEERNYLVVVGALHLVGDDSVLRMLAAAGYRSRQVFD